jgi:hypothetical protein
MSTVSTTTPPEPEELNATNTSPPFPEPEGKSIAEALAEAEASKVSQIVPNTGIDDAQTGDRVSHPVAGPGTVVNRNDLSLWVKHDGQKTEDPTMYDLRFTRALLTPLGTRTPVTITTGHTAIASGGVVAVTPEVARTLTPEEINTRYQTAMAAHVAKSQELASAWQAAKDDQTRRQQELNEVHAELKDIVAQMVTHGATVPKREEAQQRNWLASDPSVDTPRSTAPVRSQSDLGYTVPNDQVMALKDTGLTLRNLHDSIFPEFKPGKKAKDVGKMGVEIKASGYLIRDKSPDGTRWFAQLLVDKDTWEQNFQAEYGAPITNFDTTVEARQDRTKGGQDCGRVVKVGKKTVVLAPESHGLVIACSKEDVEKFESWKRASDLPTEESKPE